VGWSGPTYSKAKAVVEAADAEPALQPLVDMMDQTGNVSAAYRQLPKESRPSRTKEAVAARLAARERDRLERQLTDLLLELHYLYPWSPDEPVAEDEAWVEEVPENGAKLQAKAQAMAAAILPQDLASRDRYMQTARLFWAALDAAWTARTQTPEAQAELRRQRGH
jgi:hypothetical protein